MRVDLFRRDSKTAEPVRLGSVSFDGTDVLFHGLSEDWQKVLQKIVVRGKVFTPLDGAEYVEALPFYLRGDYLWASRPRN